MILGGKILNNKTKEIADASVEMLEILKYASPDVKSKISEEYNDFFSDIW